MLSEASNLPSIEGKEHGEIRSRVVLSYSFNSMTLRFRAVAVDPEVRVESNQSLVLTEDRLALAYQGRVFIDQVGVFSLQMQIPTNFDLESITSNQMSYWNYLTEDKRLIQINFNERIRGSHTITAALSNNAYRHQERLELPQVEILGTERETGWYHVQPELGLKVDIGETANSLVVNPEEQGIQRPGGLLLRILEKKWTASLALTRMDPWIQSESLQSYHYEEGRVEVKALIALQIENSGVRQLRLSLPDNPVTLQVRHDRVSNVRREESGDWLISLDRRVIGRLELELSYDLHDHSPGDKITTGLLRVVDASRERRFVTIHTHPAIQMIPQRQSDEMIPILWANIPERLRAFGQEPASNLIYRVSGTESNMVFALRRLTASGDLLSARVVETRILSRLSDSGYGITETRLLLHPGDERYLRLRIGKGQSLWTATVNGETAWVWREGEDWLIPLEKNTVQNAPTEVRLFVEHSLDLAKKNRVLLQVPDFSLPLQNITWVVHAPARWQIDREQVKGNLRLAEVEQVASLYNSDKWNQQDQSSQTAKGLYELGRRLYQEGNVDAASQAFRSSYNMSQNYEALNRDALVEWNRVRTQQAFQGITQRRGNIQQELPIAVMQQQTSNMAIPVQDGQDAQALMRLAQKLIEQQNAALVIPAPFTMQLPDRGGQHTIAFTRPVLVDPWASLSIELPVVRALPDSDYSRPAAALIIALIAAGLLWMWTRRR